MLTTTRKSPHHIHFSWKSFGKIAAYSILFFAFIFSIAKLRNSEYFPIHNVQVVGVQHISHQEIQEKVMPFVNNGFFSVDVDRIKEQIMQIPWVQHVFVRRIWPNKVLITVDEKVPLAIWNDSSLLSAAGELFSPATKTYPNDLPVLIGQQGEQILMTQYYAKMSEVLLPLHYKITKLELSPAMAWTITLENGIKLNIGHKDVLTRLVHFVKVYPKIVGERVADVEYIDLRYPNGMAVRWKQSHNI